MSLFSVGMVYAIQHPFTGEMIYPSDNAHWRYQQEEMLRIMQGWCPYELKDLDDANIGLKGSPTKIAKASDKVRKGAGEKVTLDPDEAVAYLMGKFDEKHII